MTYPEDVLHEAHRLQMLLYIKQRGSASEYELVVEPASWGARDFQDSQEVLRELIDEGFVEQPETPPHCVPEPLRLTDLGSGYLDHLRARAIRTEQSTPRP